MFVDWVVAWSKSANVLCIGRCNVFVASPSDFLFLMLTTLADDGIVVASRRAKDRKANMLWNTYRTFRDLVEYTKNDDGSWKAEFHGAIDVAANAATLDRCQTEIQDALDQKLAEWIRGPRTTARPIRRRRSTSPKA
jgi:hypothetical protein